MHNPSECLKAMIDFKKAILQNFKRKIPVLMIQLDLLTFYHVNFHLILDYDCM